MFLFLNELDPSALVAAVGSLAVRSTGWRPCSAEPQQHRESSQGMFMAQQLTEHLDNASGTGKGLGRELDSAILVDPE